MGKSYLCSNRVSPNEMKCKKNHVMKYVNKNPLKENEFLCFSCNKKSLFNDELGMRVCDTCNVYACPDCLNIRYESLENNKMRELVSHYA